MNIDRRNAKVGRGLTRDLKHFMESRFFIYSTACTNTPWRQCSVASTHLEATAAYHEASWWRVQSIPYQDNPGGDIANTKYDEYLTTRRTEYLFALRANNISLIHIYNPWLNLGIRDCGYV